MLRQASAVDAAGERLSLYRIRASLLRRCALQVTPATPADDETCNVYYDAGLTGQRPPRSRLE